MKVDRRLDVQAASSRFSCLLHEADRRQTQPSPTQQITTPHQSFLIQPRADSARSGPVFSPADSPLPFLFSLASKPTAVTSSVSLLLFGPRLPQSRLLTHTQPALFSRSRHTGAQFHHRLPGTRSPQKNRLPNSVLSVLPPFLFGARPFTKPTNSSLQFHFLL